jgi:hypothetical protein
MAMPLFAQYAGPAVLTRGEAPAAMNAPRIDFRPYLDVSGTYDTGLSGVAINSQGQVPRDSSYGVSASGGVSGSHSWKHTMLGLDYRASIRHYSTNSYYDGTDQSLMLGVTHRLTRHVNLSVRENAGLFGRNFGAPTLPQTVPFDPQTTYAPTNDFFDNRTIYLSTQADLTIQKTSRLSFDIGGDGFLTRRRSSALYGVSGAGARGDVQYRLTRRSTIGVSYSYTHYAYTGIFSSTDLHGATGTYAVRLSRSLEFTAYGGIYRAETKFPRSVVLDPVVAAILGITEGVAVNHDIRYVPNMGARFSRTLYRGVIYISGGHSVTPGNGLFLTSSTTSVSAGYAYTGLRRWSFNASANWGKSDSISNVNGSYGSYSGTLSMSRQIARYTHMVIGADARKYNSSDFDNYNRWIYSVRIGLGFSPGNIPMRLW